jgi:hypothetical protein
MNSEIKFWGALISIAVPAIAKVDGEDSGGRELMLGCMSGLRTLFCHHTLV